MRGFWIVTFALLVASAFATAAPPTQIHWRTESLRRIYAPPEGFYCYAPGVIRDGATEHVFACRNEVAGVIRDHVYYFRVDADGAVVSPPVVVLGPDAEGTWDRFHICDPSPLAGRFRWGETVYRYALFFLGNNVDASMNNQVGVAFANDLAGPWRRVGRPLVAGRAGFWGTGQPSAVSVDREGKVLLFYTRGDPRTAGYVREVDLSDVDRPVVGEERRLPAAGLTRSDGRPDYFNNFDVALDEANGRLVAVRERHPHPASDLTFIGDTVQLVALPLADLRKPEAAWTVLGDLTPADTHVARNHNAGLVRDAFGRLPEADRVRVVFSSSAAGADLHGLFAPFTYALYRIDGDLPPAATEPAAK